VCPWGYAYPRLNTTALRQPLKVVLIQLKHEFIDKFSGFTPLKNVLVAPMVVRLTMVGKYKLVRSTP
jgi:hypothetical protein